EVSAMDFVKIDIEGHEPRMLQGSLKTLARFYPLIQIELNPPVLAHFGNSIDAVLAPLKDLGYKFYEVRRNKLIPLKRPEDDNLVNAWCLHPTRSYNT
ncbi:MAG: hypothetical protein JWO48_1223, partial [Bryobacterales bacterium]|nr:hypothetical protein [Bryobacterales bacterium]